MLKKYVVALILGFFCLMKSQTFESKKDTVSNYSKFLRNTTFSGLLQTRYLVSLTKDVDVNGTNILDADKRVGNSFSLRRARFIVKSKVNDRFDLGIMLNFAEFNNANLTGKVLEQAFVRYSHNKFFKIQMGQFRPYFGLEDEIPTEFLKSVDFSNGYSLLSKNGWQSYQTGIAIYGDINTAKFPFKYYVGVTNGNSRGQEMDSDNSKHAYARLEKEFPQNLKLGINGGMGSYSNKSGNIIGADIDKTFFISKKISFELISEYKEGNNFTEFSSSKLINPDVKDFCFRNYYFNPVIHYQLNAPRLRSIEISGRYEYLNPNYKLGGNARRTYTPMVNFEFSDQYAACLQLGAMIEDYEKNLPLTSEYDHATFFAQVQLRF
jgi:hypothetical protein